MKNAQPCKKYHRGVLVSASMGIGINGAGLLCTIIVAQIVLGLECTCFACELLGVGGKFISRRLAIKAKKHDEIRVLADRKLNTITALVSAALIDGKSSDQEFRLVLSKVFKYHEMKEKNSD